MKEIFDSQFDEKHGLLLNKLGLTDSLRLEKAIAELSSVRVAELGHTPIRGNFDIPHLCAIHGYIFQDVFPWAGKFREVTTSRSNYFGFPPPRFLVPSLETLFIHLRKERYLVQLDAEMFTNRAGYYMGELNAIHPFREGNGRTQREFIRTLALSAGHRLSWKQVTAEENDLASRISFVSGNHSALTAMLRKCLI